jgi:hypothetical protein
MGTYTIPGPLGHDVHLANAHRTLRCDAGCQRGHTPGPIRVADDKKESEEDFIIHKKAMEFVEQKILKLYQTLPREDRIDLKVNGTVAVGALREKGKPGDEPEYWYTTASNGGSEAFHKAAQSLDLIWWDGDAGVAMTRQGPPRNYPPNSPPPPGKGGIQHAEQLMIGFAEDYGYVIDGMAVSRDLCKDCQRVIPGHKGGKMMISVILDPDTTLPNPRKENWEKKKAKAAQEAAQKETGGGPAAAKPVPPPDKVAEADKRHKDQVFMKCQEARANPDRAGEALIAAEAEARLIENEEPRAIANEYISSGWNNAPAAARKKYKRDEFGKPI